tara:strand:+ start:181 stop:429 length:249 start_codon:yes stop_codon:yes gene_type:complete
MKELEYNENIIEDLGLTEMQVLNIISRWYVNGMMPDIIQNEDGWELDELVDDLFFTKFEEEKLIKDTIFDIECKINKKNETT